MANEKFCSGCGTKISEDTVFCPNCGTKQDVAVVEETPVEAVETVAENNGGVTEAGLNLSGFDFKKYAPIIGIGAGAVVLIIVIIAIIVSLTKWQKIDPNDICRVDFSGANGMGSAQAGFAFDEITTIYLDSYFGDSDDVKAKDIAKLVKKIDKEDLDDLDIDDDELDEVIEEYFGGKKLKISDYVSIDEDTLLDAFTKAGDEDEALEMRDALLENVEFKIADKKNNGSLKNGDKIKIEVEYDEDELKEYGIKITEDEFEVTVSGLKDAVELDVFEGIKVEFSGIDGDGDAILNTDACPDFVKTWFSIRLSDDWYLSLGDVIQLTVNYWGYDYDDELGGVYDEDSDTYYLFKMENSKDITVEGLTPLEEVDVFEYIDIKYSGVAPDDVDVDWEWKENAPEYVTDNVSISGYAYNVEDGESLTFSAYAYSSFAEEGYKLKSSEMTFIVDFDDVPTYATATDAKSGTVVNEYLENYFSDDDDWYDYIYIGGSGWVDSVTSTNVKATYFKYNKEQGSSWNTNNIYARVYEVKGKAGDKDVTFYYVLSVKNVLALDGALIDDGYYISTKSYNTLAEAKEGYGTSDSDYTATEIK